MMKEPKCLKTDGLNYTRTIVNKQANNDSFQRLHPLIVNDKELPTNNFSF